MGLWIVSMWTPGIPMGRRWFPLRAPRYPRAIRSRAMSLSEIFAPGLLDGRVALVTGGGTGLGRAAAAELRACGAEVVISGRRRQVLDEAAGGPGGPRIDGGGRE